MGLLPKAFWHFSKNASTVKLEGLHLITGIGIMDRLSDEFENELLRYRAQHKTRGCKICHLIGVPLILVSLPMFLISWRRALLLAGLGWLFQITGHYVFEQNRPHLASDPRNPFIYLSAICFVGQEWLNLIAGNGKPDCDPIDKLCQP